jgi:hypothetical protein
MRKVNNVNQHFCTAFFHDRLKGETSYRSYLDVVSPVAQHCKWSVDGESGEQNQDHSYWRGFVENAAKGLVLECLAVHQGTGSVPTTNPLAIAPRTARL